MQTLEVEVKGPGSGRESALRALQAVGLHHHLDPRRDADPAQRLPAAQAPARLIGCGRPAGRAGDRRRRDGAGAADSKCRSRLGHCAAAMIVRGRYP